MNIPKKLKDYNYHTNQDVFGNYGKSTNDHIWPTSKDGSNSPKNIISLTSASNNLKGNNTSGKINNTWFRVLKTSSINELICGTLEIRKPNHNWQRVHKSDPPLRIRKKTNKNNKRFTNN